MAASSRLRFPPYFYIRFGRKRPTDDVFSPFVAIFAHYRATYRAYGLLESY